MPTEESTLIENLVRWFWGISDGGWGPASIHKMLTAMGVPKTEHPALWPKYNRIIMSPTYRRIIAAKYGIDVKHSEVDSIVAQVRFRRISGFPVPLAFQPVTKAKRGDRDPRLPTPGTEIVKIVPGSNGYMVKISVVEGPQSGKFDMAIDGRRVLTEAGSLSKCARVALDIVQGVKDRSKLNGYEFFGLAKKPRKAPKNVEEIPPAPEPDVETVKKTFTEADHRARPSVLWGATLIQLNKGGWIALARGIVAHGNTPEEAMDHWDTVFKTGFHP